MNSKGNKRNWKVLLGFLSNRHVTISIISSITESAEGIDDKIVYMEDLKKRKTSIWNMW
ncbi:kinase-like domain-containing protein [Rhizophagus irregularis DAOM 181602=DAOM 197198]|uniref:Uncharacterized protein n=1 Tax=Rhizophagus irregularis (strain DAOM 181602 / DAOM 197198 / MUCL 43194) TaxID=747089 RepID=A0A2P4QSD3_RHIID|nr:hypothetical protein GLOIN_2v1764393 [Rhizophagus irregularis DAOM 181602=DAOM 197198]POG80540.1 hypothetical protein GLOIN_2v1764393 [Rhizophagus irregularis DAOM 181602=DAOM 197198]GET50517.1 kinase-like domain-containing protein [Rhizophagus irregularis DAOM 181602=DAOM 197198]|eukprot:XP_025187406.1 hypothetical protein GLOIN_2v1764393 [Rhizophagus irregularis DAOM 181602=DAOM 197198]